MKFSFTKSTMVMALLGLSTHLFAQDSTPTSGRFSPQEFRTWSVGVHGGILSYNTIFNNSSVRAEEFNSIGYGAFVKKQILPSLGIQADFLRGKIKTAITPGETVQNIKYSGAVTAVLNVANFSGKNENAYLIPYIKAGAGYMSSDFSTNVPNVGGQYTGREGFFIPTGVGFKIGVAKGVNLDFGYDVNFVKSPSSIGKYEFSYGHGGVEFALGSADKPQLQNYSAIADLRKKSAAESAELRRALSSAEENAARDRAQYAKDLGDDDNDGVANKFDKCAGTTAGTVVDGSGCPLVTPKPQIIKETKVVVTEADRRVVNEAIKNLEFDLGKSTIRSKSYTTLNRVAALLMEKDFSLKLAGHTDITGSRELNLRLSKARAESIKAYLVSQGANASRIEATGYGPDQPIATNKTAEGRQQNRRVEFTIY
ncbi:MAG: OmpA family protein [Pedobacter sp.]|nr:OmpA family protein [Pedobacter sp.]